MSNGDMKRENDEKRGNGEASMAEYFVRVVSGC
jgi:hypothetical protein